MDKKKEMGQRWREHFFVRRKTPFMHFLDKTPKFSVHYKQINKKKRQVGEFLYEITFPMHFFDEILSISVGFELVLQLEQTASLDFLISQGPVVSVVLPLLAITLKQKQPVIIAAPQKFAPTTICVSHSHLCFSSKPNASTASSFLK